MSWLCCLNFCKRPTVKSLSSSPKNKENKTVIYCFLSNRVLGYTVSLKDYHYWLKVKRELLQDQLYHQLLFQPKKKIYTPLKINLGVYFVEAKIVHMKIIQSIKIQLYMDSIQISLMIVFMQVKDLAIS